MSVFFWHSTLMIVDLSKKPWKSPPLLQRDDIHEPVSRCCNIYIMLLSCHILFELTEKLTHPFSEPKPLVQRQDGYPNCETEVKTTQCRTLCLRTARSKLFLTCYFLSHDKRKSLYSGKELAVQPWALNWEFQLAVDCPSFLKLFSAGCCKHLI